MCFLIVSQVFHFINIGHKGLISKITTLTPKLIQAKQSTKQKKNPNSLQSPKLTNNERKLNK